MPILIGSAAMAGAAITPPTTRAVEPSRSFFIILPLIDQRLVRTKRPVRPTESGSPNSAPRALRQYGQTIKTLWPNKGQEMDAPLHDSPRTCGVFVTI